MSLLTLNAGSSSLKFALFPDDGDDAPALLSGMIEGLGTRARLLVTHTNGTQRVDEPLAPAGDTDSHEARGRAPSAGARSMVNDTDEALALVLARLPEWTAGEAIRAIGHRVVHGGIRYTAPALIDDRVLADLNALTALAPLHQPFNLRAIAAAQRRFPGVPQVACFDTAFHRGHAFVHDAFALPRELHEAGVRRYGFHGLSYEFIAGQLRALDPAAHQGRVVVAHLGSGASLCALHEGRSLASSMGFSALDGLPMGTRPGQLDAGVLLWLMTERQMDAAALTDLLYRRSGLAGLSGMGGDMRTLQASTEPAAREAVDYFIARLREQIGAMAAALGGIDALVFTAGIGEHDPIIRARTIAGLGFLGLALDDEANAGHGRAHGGRISPPHATARVWVIPTSEEQVIARHLRAALDGSGDAR